EVEVDGVWTPVDPLIIDLMRRWGGLDPAAWPHHRSPGAMLAPLVWDPLTPHPLVSRVGHGVPTPFLARIVTGSSQAMVAAASCPSVIPCRSGVLTPLFEPSRQAADRRPAEEIGDLQIVAARL